jgi:uncharacterized RDD family membrane protein YckC
MGPVTAQALESLIRDRIIDDTTLVWATGMADWQPWGKLAPETAVCAVSSGRYFQRDMVPYDGKFISAEHKDEFFQKMREGVSSPAAMIYGGFWIRVLAKIIDGLVLGAVNMLLAFGLSMVLFGSMGMVRRGQPPNIAAILGFEGLVILSGMGIGLLYNWYFVSRHAATPGKMALGLKIVRPNGVPLTNGRIIGRFFAEWISGMVLYVGYIMAGLDDQKQALHDRICDTRVIKAK